MPLASGEKAPVYYDNGILVVVGRGPPTCTTAAPSG